MRVLTKMALLAATAMTPGVAFAASPAPTPVPAAAAQTANEAGDADSFGDIVVTARKKQESLQRVPIAITAFDSKLIEAARIERLSDVAKLTPGLVFTPLFGRQNQLPIIRGAAQTFGQLNVGVFLDGIYLSGKAGADAELNDLERIEIVKGPQSALYGRNTFAGAINYVTKPPSADLTGRAEASIGDNGLYKIQGNISGPITDTLRIRIGGFYRQFDGFYRSSVDGGRVDFEKSYGATGTLEFKPTDNFTATLRASYSKSDDGQPPSNVIRTNAGFGTPSGGSATQQRNLLFIGTVPAIAANGVTVNTLAVPGLPGGRYGDREEAIRTSLKLEYNLGFATLTSMTSFDKRNQEFTFDGDNTICDRTGGCPNFGFPFAPAIPLGKSDFAFSSSRGYLRDLSQEFRLASQPGGPVDWLFGFFFYDNITNTFDRGFTPTATLAITDYTAAAAAYRYPQSILTTTSYAGFGSVTWHVTDKFSATSELRYESESQTFVQGPSVATGTTGSTAVFNLAQSFSFVTPRIILNYQFDPNKMVYFSYGRGAKTGGFNTGLNVFANQRSYDPEYSNNYEIGFKSELMNRRLRLNLAAFHTDWTSQQAACQNPVSAGGSSTNRTYTCNVATSKIYGIEAEALVRLDTHFSIAANYAYTNARYDSFVDDSLAQNLILAGLPAINFAGKRLPYVPEHKLAISPQYTTQIGQVGIEARADLQFQSRTFVRADNLQSFAEKEVLDLRITARYAKFNLQVFANNVLQNDVPVAGVRFFDSVNYSVASPLITGANRRQIGVSLGYAF